MISEDSEVFLRDCTVHPVLDVVQERSIPPTTVKSYREVRIVGHR